MHFPGRFLTRCRTACLSACLGFFLFHFCEVSARAGEYLIDVWSGENGLPNSSVTAVAQTPDGYLWVGTYNGLTRFDGVRFVTFDPVNTPELEHARVRRLFVDSEGTLWINTYDGSLTAYRDGKFTLEWKGDGSTDSTASLISGQAGKIVFLLHNGELLLQTNRQGGGNWRTVTPPGASSGEICIQDSHGLLWGRGRDQRLWRFDGKDFEVLPAGLNLGGQFINSLVSDAAGRVWVGTDKEIAVWDGRRFQQQTPTNGEPVLNVAFLAASKDGSLWVFANDRVRKTRNGQWIFEVEACRGVFGSRIDRLGVDEDRAGGTWIYHYGQGIFHVRPDGRTRQLAAEENFPGERVDCFHQDLDGNFWAGVDRGGLVRLRERRFNVLMPADNGATKAAVSVAEDGQGAIWLGTFGDGLHCLDEGQWRNISLPGGNRRGFVFSVLPDFKGQLWASAGEEDLYLQVNGQFQIAQPAVHGVKALLAGRDGRLWIATKSGLDMLSQGKLRQFRPEDGGVNRLEMHALAEGPNGEIWTGDGNGDLYRIDAKTSRFHADGKLGNQPIWSMLADVDGSLWVGTFRGGLLLLQDGKFSRFTSEQGLPDDVICQLLDDGSGRLWAGSHKGIFCMSKADLRACAAGKIKKVNCISFGKFDGLPSLECSGGYQPACWRTGDGRLLFSTLKGVVAVQPQDMATNSLPPPTVLENILVDGELQAIPPPTAKNTFARLVVPPGKRQLEFQYTGLSFVSPDRMRFRYRLNGVDKDWVEVGTRRSAQYSFLRPGQYLFDVQACNNDGVWSAERSASLQVEVQPYFYETQWFIFLGIVAVVGLIAVLVRALFLRRLRRQLEHVERLRAVERDRARIAKDIHDDLGAGLTHISLLTELARRNPPQEVNTHLLQISETSRELTLAMDEIVWAVDPQNDTLDSLITYLCKLAQEYLAVANVRLRMDLPAQMPPLALRAEVRHNLFLAFKEVLNNIIKHAGATEVWLRLGLRADSFVLSVEDDGRGLATAKAEESRPGRIMSGHGLANLERRLIASGGRCSFHSEPGRGTRVDFEVFYTGLLLPEMPAGGGKQPPSK